MSQQEPHEIKKGQKPSPAPGKAVLATRQSGDAWPDRSFAEKALGVVDGQQAGHE